MDLVISYEKEQNGFEFYACPIMGEVIYFRVNKNRYSDKNELQYVLRDQLLLTLKDKIKVNLPVSI